MSESNAAWVAILILEVLSLAGIVLAWWDGRHRGEAAGRDEGVDFGVHHGIHEERHRWCQWLVSQPYPPPIEELKAFCASAGITIASERMPHDGSSKQPAETKTKHHRTTGCRCAYCERPMPHLPPDYEFAVCAACQERNRLKEHGVEY